MSRRIFLFASLLLAGACDQDRLTGIAELESGPTPTEASAQRVSVNLAVEDAIDRILPTLPGGEATLALESALIALRDGAPEMSDLFLADAFDAVSELAARTEGHEADLDVVLQALQTVG